MKNLLTASAARLQTNSYSRLHQKATIYSIKDKLDAAIMAAIERGLCQASITAPAEAEIELLNGLRRALIKLGYKVRLDHNHGAFEEGFYAAPTVTVTLSW